MYLLTCIGTDFAVGVLLEAHEFEQYVLGVDRGVNKRCEHLGGLRGGRFAHCELRPLLLTTDKVLRYC